MATVDGSLIKAGRQPEARPVSPAALGRTLGKIIACLDVEETLTATLDVVRETLGAEAGTIRLFEEASGDLRLAATAGVSEDEAAHLPQRVPLQGDGISARVARSRAPICLHRAEDVEREAPHARARFDLASLLCLPLLAQERLAGTLLLGARRPHAFGPDDLTLAEAIGQVAALALDRAALHGRMGRLVDAAMQAKARGDALAEIGRALASAHDFQQVLDLIADQTVAATRCDACVIFQWVPERKTFHTVRGRGLSNRFLREDFIANSQSVSSLVMQSGHPIWTADVLADSRFQFSPPAGDRIAHEGFRTVLSVPINLRSGIFGTLVTYRCDRHEFTDDEVRFQEAIAGQAAVAIETARLFERQREAATQAERQRARAEALAAVGQAISASLDLDQVLSLLVERAAAVTGADAAAVLERDPATGVLRSRRAHGLSLEFSRALVLPPGGGLSGAALAAGEPRWTPDIQSDPLHRVPALEDLEAADGIHGILSVPIRCGEEPYGALNLYRRGPGPFDGDVVAFAARIAEQAALAIANARLFRQTHERAETIQRQHAEAQALLEVSQALTQTLDLEQVFDLIAEKVLAVSGADACGIARVMPEGDLEYVRAQGFTGPGLLHMTLRRGEGLMGRCLETGAPVWTRDLQSDPAITLRPERRARVEMRGGVAVPIGTAEDPTGVLFIGRRGPHDHTPEEIAFAVALAAQAGIAIQNARLFQQEQARRRQVEAVRAVTEEIARELDLKELLGIIHRQAAKLVGAASGTLYLWDEAAQVLIPAAWHGPEAWRREVRCGLGEGISGTVAQRRSGLIVNDYRSSPYASPLFLERTDVTASLAEPLLYRDRLLGVITVDHQEPGHTFTELDQETLALFAAQAAIAIENARLYAQTREALAEQAAIHEAAQAIAQSLDLAETLQRILAAAMRLAEMDKGIIWLLDPEREVLVGTVAAGLVGERELRVSLSAPSLAAASVRESRSLVSERPEEDLRCNPAVQARFGNKALLAIPLRSGDRIIGVLDLGDLTRRHQFTESRLAMLERLAHQAVVAIENARLYWQAEQRAARLRALADITAAVSGSLDPQAVLDLVVDRVCLLIGAPRSALAIAQEREGEETLRFVAQRGLSRDFSARIRPTHPRRGTTATAFATRRPVWSADILNDPDFPLEPEARAAIEAEGYRAVLSAPLIAGKRAVGALVVYRDEPGPFSADEVELLQIFAGQAAIAIENARLFQRQRLTAARAEALAAVGRAISASLDLDEVLALAVERAAAVTESDAAAILQREPSTGALRFRKAHGLRQPVDQYLLPAGQGIAGAALAAGEPIWTRDLPQDPRFQRPGNVLTLVAEEGIHGTLSAPIRGREAPYGVLSLYRRTPHLFDEEEIAFAARIADQAAIAIENARLYQEEQERRRQVEAVRDIAAEITRELDLSALLALIYRRAVELLGAGSGTLYLWDEPTQALAPRAWPEGEAWRGKLPLRLGEGLSGTAAQRRRGIIANDYRTSRYANPLFLERTRATAAMAEPFLYGDRLLGTITIDNGSTGRLFTERDREALALLANQAAIAIENARLYEDSQRRAREATALAEVARVLNASLDAERVLDAIIHGVQQVTGAPFAGIMLLDEECRELRYVRGIGVEPERFARVRLKVGEGIAGQAVERGVPLQHRRLLTDAPPVSSGLAEQEGFRSILSAPLLAQGQPVGALVVFRREEYEFSTAEIRLLATLGSQAAIAIANARLFDRQREAAAAAERQRARAEALAAVGQALSASLNLDKVLSLLTERTVVATGAYAAAVLEREPSTGGLKFRKTHGLSARYMEGLVLSSAGGISGVPLTTGQPQGTADILEDARFTYPPETRARMVAEGVHGMLSVPIRGTGEPYGALNLYWREAHRCDAEEIAFAVRIADQAAIAIENTRLYAESQRAYGDLMAAQEQLLQVEKLKALGEMAGGVAHDFNNMLAVILGQAQLLQLRTTDGRQHDGLKVIERAALDGAETVRRILGFARVGSEASYVPVDVAALLPQVLEVTRPRWKDEAQGRGIAIEVGVALEPVPPIRGNPAELREVLVNLVFNAVDAVPQGGRITVGARRLHRPGRAGGALNPHHRVLADQVEETEELVEIFVRDTGMGMPEEVRRRAFDPFFTTKGVKGTGLGLSVVYGIVSRHGGEVLLESQEGAGTTVAIRLPATAQAAAGGGEAAPGAARPGRIVVVDDEEALADLLAEILRMQHHRVEVFTDPRRALEYVARQPVDLLFTDLGMPDLSGWDVAAQARAILPDLPVVLVTGWGHQIEPSQAQKTRVHAVVAKPYRVEDILRVVAEILPTPTPPAA